MSLPWKNLNSPAVLNAIKADSLHHPIVIFKHSTRCGVSAAVKDRLENTYEQVADEDYYYLDLLSYRDISNAIADDFKVYHQSPQIILIKNGECTYDESHYDIHFAELKEQILS